METRITEEVKAPQVFGAQDWRLSCSNLFEPTQQVVRRSYCSTPVGGTKQEVIEQIARFTLSSSYAASKQSMGALVEAAKSNIVNRRAA